MIPIKGGESSTRRLLFQQQQNEENMRVELEIIDKVQEMTRIREEVANQKIRYKGSIMSLSTWRPRMASPRGSQKRS